ncbi:MAG: hypothetical protein NZ903_01500, partial [Candidatus Micrarchaeota archaeon]|nr:hypothetical protein [Candidatus Micrarchaeota archaeon]
MRHLVFLLIVFSFVYGACIETKKEIYAPAVINENSSKMVKITLEIKNTNDSGRIFYALKPTIGVETQKSMIMADYIARKMAIERGIDVKGCDITISISEEGDVRYIEGPSAGALLTVLILSGFENKILQPYITITGTIESDGRIGSVGGLPLKAEASYKTGFKRIIFPAMTNSEKIELLMLKRYYNITILQAKRIEEAYQMMLQPTQYSENLSLEPEESDEYKEIKISHKYEKWISEITERMLADAEKEIRNIGEEYKENFKSRLNNAKAAYFAKQYYTAANIAFLLAIDKEISLFSRERMVKEYAQTKSCLKQFEKKIELIKKNRGNFEILGPAETRYMWAKIRLERTVGDEDVSDIAMKSEFISPLLSKYKGIINAKYWCLAAHHMIDVYNENYEYDKEFNERNLKSYAKEVLASLNFDPE